MAARERGGLRPRKPEDEAEEHLVERQDPLDELDADAGLDGRDRPRRGLRRHGPSAPSSDGDKEGTNLGGTSQDIVPGTSLGSGNALAPLLIISSRSVVEIGTGQRRKYGEIWTRRAASKTQPETLQEGAMPMRTSIPCAILAALVLLPLRDARAQAQTEEDERKVFVAGVNFREGAVGVVVLEKQPGGPTTISTSFFEFRAKSGEVHKLGRSEYKSLFAEFEAKKLATLPEWGEPPQAVVTSDGDRFETEYTDCEPQDEGGPLCKGQFIIHHGDKWQLDTRKQCPVGCSVLIANKWNDQLWIGLGALGESDWYGFGIQVYDLRTKKLTFADSRAPFPVFLRLDPSRETMWLAGGQLWGFNKKFRIVRKCVPFRSSGHIKFECGK